MSRLLTILSYCLVAISLSMLTFQHKKVELEEEKNPEENPITELRLSTALPFSNLLINYENIGLRFQAGAINCLVVSRTDSNLVLAGSNNGGVWISHDAAHTWQPVNDTAHSLCVTSIAQNYFRSNEFYYSSGVNIFVNGDLQYDIFRSVDNGQTFNPVTPVTNPGFGRVDKILPSQLDGNTMYFLQKSSTAGVGSVYRTLDNCATFQLIYQVNNPIDDMILLPNGTLEIGYNHSIWRSYSGDFGTFVQSTGLGTTGYNTRLAFCQSQPNIQYSTVYMGPGYDLYKSIDTGQTWTYMSHSAYGIKIAVKPDNPDFVFAGTITSSVSLDGGLTWQSSFGGHDLRSFNFDPNRSGKVYITSDFGIKVLEVDPVTPNSFNIEYHFDSLLYSQEAYNGDCGASGVQSIAGYQDLGSRFIQNLTQSKYVLSGDGGWAWLSKQNPDLGYFSAQYGDIYRSSNLSASNPSITSILNQLDTNNNYDVDEGSMFIHPFVMNNADDNQLYFPTLHRLWRSTDRGDNWTPVSHWYGNQYYTVNIACNNKPNPIVYWANSDSVFVFANASNASPLTDFGRPAPFNSMRCYVDPNRDSALFLTNRVPPYRISYCDNVFNPAAVWTDIPTAQLAGVTIQCLAIYPGNDQVIFAGSKEGGLYVTRDRGITWTKELNMPNVQITEIKIRESDMKVFIFTYGRGTWTADFDPTLSLTEKNISSKITMYPNPFQDHFVLEFEKELSATVEMYDVQGKLCLKKFVSGKLIKIETEKLLPGFYEIRVLDGDKRIYQTKGLRM